MAIIQSAYTELLDDEAYYWVYSLKPGWGYFDHPPVIALLIKCGYFLFHNELGVRLVPMFLCIGSVYLIEKLVKPSDYKLFYGIVLSIAILQIGCSMAVPDVPLLFFSLVFFHAYKAFLQSANLKNSLWLALSMALLMYSKYQGVLIILFTIAANLKLLKEKYFWLALFVFVLLLFPHLIWQMHYGFPSLKYHWVERFKGPYRPVDMLNYLVTQPFIFGPFMGLIFIYCLIVFKPADTFERALKMNVIGVYAFFFIMTFKGTVEGNWTLVILLPMIYMAYRQAQLQLKLRKLIMRLLPVSLGIIIAVRVFLIYDFVPAKWSFDTEFHNSKVWAKQIEQVAGNTPVAFINSFQLASKYMFYTGHEAFALNNIMGRKNQFTIWDSENEFQGKRVLVIANYTDSYCLPLKTCKDVYGNIFIDNFRSFGNVKITPEQQYIKVKRGDSIHIKVSLCYGNSNTRDFEANPGMIPQLSCVILKSATEAASETDLQRITNSMVDCKNEYIVSAKAPDVAGHYALSICVKDGFLPASLNDNRVELDVEE